MGVQMSIFDLVSSFGKTSPELSQVTEAKILEPSWKNFVESKKTTFQFLCLTAESGRIAEQSPATASLLHGDLWTLNISEYLNAASVSPLSWTMAGTMQRTYYYRESRLSEILQTEVSEKYYLSARACEGILRRADKRGKELPEVLKRALTDQISREQTNREAWAEFAEKIRTPSKSGGGSDTYLKSDGSIGTAGKGALVQTEQSATLGVSQDQTLFAPAYGLGRDSFNSGTNAQYTMSIEEETQPPITERGAGGGMLNSTVNALCNSDWRGVGNQYVNDGKVILEPHHIPKE